MAKDEKKEATPKFTFEKSYGVSKYYIKGVPVSPSDKKAEKTYEETIEDVEKADLLDERKDLITTKMKAKADAIRKQGEPNPKRYIVDPETGQIGVDEEGGEYTQKEAMMISASIKGKSGQYDAAIALITAAKALAPEAQSGVVERPKEFYVDPETGTIVKDPENGEYTLSEARAISQSIRKENQPTQPASKTFLDKLEDITEGLVGKRIAAMLSGDNTPKPTNPLDELLNTVDQVEKVKQLLAPSGGSAAQTLAQSGIRGELLKLMLEDERDRLKMKYEHDAQMERNKHLGVMASTVKENFADGIQAIRMAAQEIQKAGVSSPAKPEEASPQSFACSCGMKFSAPAGWAGQPLKCPNPQCGREYSKEELLE